MRFSIICDFFFRLISVTFWQVEMFLSIAQLSACLIRMNNNARQKFVINSGFISTSGKDWNIFLGLRSLFGTIYSAIPCAFLLITAANTMILLLPGGLNSELYFNVTISAIKNAYNNPIWNHILLYIVRVLNKSNLSKWKWQLWCVCYRLPVS